MRHQANIPWPEIVDQAIGHALRHELGVLVIDTFGQWCGLSGESENSAGAVVEAIQPLTLAAAGDGLAVCVIAHQRKTAGDHGDAIRGSNALAGAVDVVVELERVKGDDAARVLRSTSRFTSTPTQLVIRLSAGRYQACGTLADVTRDTGDQRILDALRAVDHPLTAADLAAVDLAPDDLSVKAIAARLSRLHADGLVERTGDGVKGDPYRFFPSPRTDPLSGENESGAARPRVGSGAPYSDAGIPPDSGNGGTPPAFARLVRLLAQLPADRAFLIWQEAEELDADSPGLTALIAQVEAGQA